MEKTCAGCGACGHPPQFPQFRPGRPPIPICRLSGEPGAFDNTHLLIAASCTAYTCSEFHQRFVRSRTVLIGCPDAEHSDYLEKLSTLIAENDVKTVTLVRMESACCDALAAAVRAALLGSEKFIPWQIITLHPDGSVVE